MARAHANSRGQRTIGRTRPHIRQRRHPEGVSLGRSLRPTTNCLSDRRRSWSVGRQLPYLQWRHPEGVSHGRSQRPKAIILSDRRRSGTVGRTNNRSCKGVTPKGSATEEGSGPRPSSFLTGEGVEPWGDLTSVLAKALPQRGQPRKKSAAHGHHTFRQEKEWNRGAN